MSEHTPMDSGASQRRRSVLAAVEERLASWDRTQDAAGVPRLGDAAGQGAVERLSDLEVLVRHARHGLMSSAGAEPGEPVLLAIAAHALGWVEALYHAGEIDPTAGEPT